MCNTTATENTANTTTRNTVQPLPLKATWELNNDLSLSATNLMPWATATIRCVAVGDWILDMEANGEKSAWGFDTKAECAELANIWLGNRSALMTEYDVKAAQLEEAVRYALRIADAPAGADRLGVLVHREGQYHVTVGCFPEGMYASDLAHYFHTCGLDATATGRCVRLKK